MSGMRFGSQICFLFWLILYSSTIALSAPDSLPHTNNLLFRIGGEMEDEKRMLVAPENLAVDKDGNIYLIDIQERYLRKYDARGHFLWQTGRPGDGPGEFTAPGFLGIFADGTIAAYDIRSRRLSFFDPYGKFLRAKVASKAVLWPTSFWTRGTTIYIGGSDLDPDQEWRAAVKAYDSDGEYLGSRLPQGLAFPRATGMAYPCFRDAPDGGFWAFDSAEKERFHLEKYGPEGELERTIEKKGPPVPYSAAERVQRAENYKKAAARIGQPAPEPPKYKIKTRALWEDDAGRVYVSSGRSDGPGYSLEVFDKQGDYLGSISPGPQGKAVLRNGRFHQIETDEESGFLRIAVYEFECTAGRRQ